MTTQPAAVNLVYTAIVFSVYEGAIFLVNLFFGWTGLGWLIALIWSATAVRRRGYYRE